MTTASTLTISSATSPVEVRTWGDLAWAIAEFGPSAVESNLIAAAAFAQDRDPMLARIIVDDAQADVVRARDFVVPTPVGV